MGVLGVWLMAGKRDEGQAGGGGDGRGRGPAEAGVLDYIGGGPGEAASCLVRSHISSLNAPRPTFDHARACAAGGG